MTPEELLKLCDEIEALLKAATPFAYIYHFKSPFGGGHLSLESSDWNGQKPYKTTPVYLEDSALRNAAQPLIDAARESVLLRAIVERDDPVMFKALAEDDEERAQLRADLDKVRKP